MKNLRWRRGVPNKEGWWWLWWDDKIAREFNHRPGPQIVEVKMQGDVVPGKPELHMQLGNSRLEAFVFKGKVAGPIPRPY